MINFDNHGVIIPDVSFYQDDDTTPQKIDFAKMKAAGAAGVICRAGQNTWRDEDFQDYWRAAKEAGLPRGSYWFYDSRAEPGGQADLWKSQIGTDLPELGLWVDLEEHYGGTWKGERNWKTFIEAVKLKFPGVMVGIYTANWYWQNQTITDYSYFGRFPLWAAQYVSHPLYVILPRGWGRCVFWQYTATGDGAAYGVESLGIDLNKWNGTLAEFRAFFNLESGGEVPPTNGETMSQWYRVNTAGLNIRDAAGAGNTDIGDLYLNDRIEAEGAPVNGWLHILRVLRAGSTVPVAVDGWCSAAYCVAVVPPVIDPPTQPPVVTFPPEIGLTIGGVTKAYIPKP
jgi:lysozyme